MSNQRWRMGRGGNTVSKSIMFGFRKVKQIRWDAEWLAVRMELKWDVRVGMKQVWITGVGGDLPKAPRKTYYGKAFFPHQFSLYFNSIFHQLSEVSSINGQCAWCNFIGSLVQKEKKKKSGLTPGNCQPWSQEKGMQLWRLSRGAQGSHEECHGVEVFRYQLSLQRPVSGFSVVFLNYY